MAEELKPGDKVAWSYGRGKAVGHVVKKQITPTKIKGHNVAASKEHPEYIVRSDKSGGKAAHKASALKKVT